MIDLNYYRTVIDTQNDPWILKQELADLIREVEKQQNIRGRRSPKDKQKRRTRRTPQRKRREKQFTKKQIAEIKEEINHYGLIGEAIAEASRWEPKERPTK
ncbi:MAG: hypothetical protein D6707_09425 [Bacteroidetes bacterium]|nr:MAG: hypothetical protein D6707_09425 [Bacteroidota bacterium]